MIDFMVAVRDSNPRRPACKAVKRRYSTICPRLPSLAYLSDIAGDKTTLTGGDLPTNCPRPPPTPPQFSLQLLGGNPARAVHMKLGTVDRLGWPTLRKRQSVERFSWTYCL